MDIKIFLENYEEKMNEKIVEQADKQLKAIKESDIPKLIKVGIHTIHQDQLIKLVNFKTIKTTCKIVKMPGLFICILFVSNHSILLFFFIFKFLL